MSCTTRTWARVRQENRPDENPEPAECYEAGAEITNYTYLAWNPRAPLLIDTRDPGADIGWLGHRVAWKRRLLNANVLNRLGKEA